MDRRKRREAPGADAMISLFLLVAGSVRPPVVVVLMAAATLSPKITNAGSTLLRFAVGQMINREIAPMSGLMGLNPQGVNGISPPSNPASILSASLPDTVFMGIIVRLCLSPGLALWLPDLVMGHAP